MGWSYPVLEGLLQLSPFVGLALILRARSRPFGLFCLLFLLDKLLTVGLSGLSPGHWNWAGKGASLGWAVAFAGLNPWLTREEMGWRFAVKDGSGRFVFGLAASVLAIRLAVDLRSRGLRSRFDPETFWYQATMPGLSEEVVYRGLFLPLLGRAFPGRSLRMSHGLLLSSLLFGLVHALTFDGVLHFHSQRLVMTSALGLVLGLLVERGGSLLPAILVHNLWNLVVFRK